MDTSDGWDEQLAEQAAWLAQQQRAKAEEVPDGLKVDEEAHFDFGDDEDPEERQQRQLAEKRKAELLLLMGGAPPAEAQDTELNTKRVLTALDSVLRTLARLEEKIDRI